MKCAACGFETPEEQGYCDFCKEPFRKQPAPPPPAPASPAPESQPVKKVAVPAHLLEEIQRQKRDVAGRAPASQIPPEFSHLDPGERIPVVPSLVRRLAWAFLGICVLWIAVLSLVMLSRSKRLREQQRQDAPSQQTRGPQLQD